MPQTLLDWSGMVLRLSYAVCRWSVSFRTSTVELFAKDGFQLLELCASELISVRHSKSMQSGADRRPLPPAEAQEQALRCEDVG